MIARVIRGSVQMLGPSLTSMDTNAYIGPDDVRLTLNKTGGITMDSYDTDTSITATNGGAITIGGSGLGASGLTLNADGNVVDIGTLASDTVTLGNSSGGSVTLLGDITLGGEASNTVTLGGGNTAVTLGSAASDAVTLGTNGAGIHVLSTVQTSNGADLGTTTNKFGTLHVQTVEAVSVNATNQTYSNTTLAWSTTLMQDESADTAKFIGAPPAVKLMQLDVATMRSYGQYHTPSGSTHTYYPLQWTDPRSAGSASEATAMISANVQVYNILLILTEVFPSVPSDATFNLVWAPQTADSFRDDFAGVGSAEDNGSGKMRVQVSSVDDLTVGDTVSVSGFGTAAYNGRHTITVIATSPSPKITLDVDFVDTASAGSATFSVLSQFTAWRTDIVGDDKQLVASPDLEFGETSFDSTTMGQALSLSSGPFPLYTAVDDASDHYFAIRITTATQPTSGKINTFIFSASVGALTSS